jgi:hypothetical protein
LALGRDQGLLGRAELDRLDGVDGARLGDKDGEHVAGASGFLMNLARDTVPKAFFFGERRGRSEPGVEGSGAGDCGAVDAALEGRAGDPGRDREAGRRVARERGRLGADRTGTISLKFARGLVMRSGLMNPTDELQVVSETTFGQPAQVMSFRPEAGVGVSVMLALAEDEDPPPRSIRVAAAVLAGQAWASGFLGSTVTGRVSVQL